MQQIQVKANEAGQRLDKLLGKYLSEAPKSFLYKMLRKKNITLNGKKATGNEKLCVGDEVKLFLSDDTIAKFSKKESFTCTKEALDILYEDEHILLINKPVGMLSQKANDQDVSAVEHVISYLISTGQLTTEELATFRPSVCNRLDRNTSGILAAGKSLIGLQELSRMFKDRSLEKYYLTIVTGRVEESSVIKGYLSKDDKTNKVTILENPKGDASMIETRYRPIKIGEHCTLLEVHLITGKTHQIRAHLSSIGHPIYGDFKYGDGRLNASLKERYGLKHQLLHSYRVVFPKLTGDLASVSEKEFQAPLPKQFRKIAKNEGVL